MWPSKRTMMIIDQTSSPRAHDHFFFQCKNQQQQQQRPITRRKHYVKTKNMCIYIQINISRVLELCDTVVWHVICASVSFCLLHLYLPPLPPYVSSAVGSKLIRSVYLPNFSFLFFSFPLSNLLASFSIRLILIANTVINTAITLIVSLRLYGL